jgi:hypothetical protein
LCEQLERDDVVVLVGDEAGNLIGFAEDDAIGIAIADYAATIGDGIGNPMTDEIDEIGDGSASDNAKSDLRRAAVDGGGDGFATRVDDIDETAGCDVASGLYVGAIDPGVSVFYARGSALRDENLRILRGRFQTVPCWRFELDVGSCVGNLVL